MGRITLTKALTLTAVALTLSGFAASAEAPDPFVGTWILRGKLHVILLRRQPDLHNCRGTGRRDSRNDR